jgi:hypothetical protein
VELAGILALLAYNALLFILPGVGVFGAGILITKKKP